MKRKKRQPDAAAGGLAVAMGVSGLAIALFSSLNPGQRLSAAASGCMGLSWGLKEVAAAKKWKQEPEDDHFATSTEDMLESEREEKMERAARCTAYLYYWDGFFYFSVGLCYCCWIFVLDLIMRPWPKRAGANGFKHIHRESALNRQAGKAACFANPALAHFGKRCFLKRVSRPYEEILDGATLPRSAPGERHEKICARLHREMAASINGLGAMQLLAPRSQVPVSRTTLICPDLALVTAATGKLFLAVEIVSRDDHRMDTVTKKEVYEQLRLLRLWMVDPRYDNVETYHSFEFGLQLKAILAGSEILQEKLVPQFKVRITDLFAP